MCRFNSQAFIPEEVEKGYHLDLIKHLLDYNRKSEKFYNEIHITTDGYCTIVEWITNSFEYKDEEFKFVGYDEEVLIQVVYPDKSLTYAHTREEADDLLKLWLQEHPSWKQNQYGHWYDSSTIELVKEELLGE